MPAEVTIKSLIALDDQPSPNSLADAVGDRFLYRHNQMFARIRDFVLQLGYRFVRDDTPLWRDYQGLGLLTLHRILEGKLIPYFDNGNVLARLMESDPEVALPPRFIVSNVKHNHAFHESAHCVGSACTSNYRGFLTPACQSEREAFVLEAILVESFANTVETFGAAEDASVSHAVFYALNSYMRTNLKRKELLARLCDALGPMESFIAFLLAYVEANFASAAATEVTYSRVQKLLARPGVTDSLVKEIVDVGFSLNQGFREGTTPVYFRLLGCEREFLSMADATWLQDPDHQSVIRSVAEILADIGLFGVKSRQFERSLAIGRTGGS